MSAIDRLNEIEARANAATEGPWAPDEYTEVDPDGFYELSRVIAPDPDGDDWCAIGVVHTGILRPDAAFIAHARTDVPALVAALRAVLDLHRAHECTSSFADDDPCFIMHGGSCALSGTCRECHNNHPCLTARAIEESLS